MGDSQSYIEYSIILEDISTKLYNETEKVARFIILFSAILGMGIVEKNYSNSNRTAGGAISKSHVLLN